MTPHAEPALNLMVAFIPIFGLMVAFIPIFALMATIRVLPQGRCR